MLSMVRGHTSHLHPSLLSPFFHQFRCGVLRCVDKSFLTINSFVVTFEMKKVPLVCHNFLRNNSKRILLNSFFTVTLPDVFSRGVASAVPSGIVMD